MKIIDAHMHFYEVEGFYEAARGAGHENTAEHYLRACEENGVVFSIAMGNAEGEEAVFGGSTPRVPNLSGSFDYENYNQPATIGYCCGVKSDELTLTNAEKTVLEFERYLKTPQCVGIKLYPGYRHVYVNDRVHYPLFELARKNDLPVVIHTGDTSNPTAILKYAHPLTVDEVAVQFPDVRFVIAHCGNPWIVDAVEVASKNENVYLELSGMVAGNFESANFYAKHKGFFDHLRMWLDYLDRYDKVLYGSDWPLVNIKSYINLIKNVIPEEHHQAVFYDNALKVFPKIKELL
ncbi:MAG: amidohydrolase [Negativicutes bacterium]|nr:amidohydrolase [Negativicutes bacterium]